MLQLPEVPDGVLGVLVRSAKALLVNATPMSTADPRTVTTPVSDVEPWRIRGSDLLGPSCEVLFSSKSRVIIVILPFRAGMGS